MNSASAVLKDRGIDFPFCLSLDLVGGDVICGTASSDLLDKEKDDLSSLKQHSGRLWRRPVVFGNSGGGNSEPFFGALALCCMQN